MTPAEQDAPFWGFGEIFVSAAAFLVALQLILAGATRLLAGNAKLGYWAVLEEFLAYAVLFGVLKLLFHWRGQPLMRSLGWTHQEAFPAVQLAAFGLFLFLLGVFLQIVLRMPEDVETPFEKMLYADPFSRFAIAAFGVTAGPVIEELLFRGLLQPVLVTLAGVFPGILITSVAFAVVHLPQNANLWQSAVLIAIAGFGFGVVRHVSGSTRASSIVHIAYNALPFAVTLLQGGHSIHK